MADVIGIDIVMILIALRLMLLPNIVVDVKTTFGRCYMPSGRWNSHCFVTGGRCYCLMADFIATISSEVLNRTSSHMCGRWNLPIFLLRD